MILMCSSLLYLENKNLLIIGCFFQYIFVNSVFRIIPFSLIYLFNFFTVTLYFVCIVFSIPNVNLRCMMRMRMTNAGFLHFILSLNNRFLYCSSLKYLTFFVNHWLFFNRNLLKFLNFSLILYIA